MMIGSASKRCEETSPDAGRPIRLPNPLVLKLDQVLGQLSHSHVLRLDLGYDLTAIQNDKPIGDLVHVCEVVLDIDAGAPRRFDLAHEIDNFPDLRDAEGGGRLVKHDEVGIEMHGPADRDALTLAARQVRHGRVDGDAISAKSDDSSKSSWRSPSRV